jgi:hypothetical protein
MGADNPVGELIRSFVSKLSARLAAAALGAEGSGFVGTAVWVGAAVLIGAVLGGVLGFFGGGDTVAGAIQGLDGVPVYACPDSGEAGTLHRGDRVLITGRTSDGTWLAVRNVRGAGETVFIRADVVVEDDDVSGLPERDCEDNGIVTIGDTTSTTVTGEATTTTTVPLTTTTSTTTTTAPPTSTTTKAPDTTAPVITKETASPDMIWEEDGLNAACLPDTPRESTISAFVTDDTGIPSVNASWTDPSGSHTVPMTPDAGTYRTVFGPYAADDWDPASESPYDHEVTVTIRAEDAAGNASVTTVTVTVFEIGECS